MPLAPAITDLEQLKNHPAVARLVDWNREAVTRAKFKGVKLSAGQQYWVIAGTDSKDSTAFAAWAFNTTEQIKTVRFAENIGTGWELVNASARPSPAFAVYGN